MNLITKAFSKIFKSTNQQELDRVKPLINNINALEDDVFKLKMKILNLERKIYRKSVMEGKK